MGIEQKVTGNIVPFTGRFTEPKPQETEGFELIFRRPSLEYPVICALGGRLPDKLKVTKEEGHTLVYDQSAIPFVGNRPGPHDQATIPVPAYDEHHSFHPFGFFISLVNGYTGILTVKPQEIQEGRASGIERSGLLEEFTKEYEATLKTNHAIQEQAWASRKKKWGGQGDEYFPGVNPITFWQAFHSHYLTKHLSYRVDQAFLKRIKSRSYLLQDVQFDPLATPELHTPFFGVVSTAYGNMSFREQSIVSLKRTRRH